MIRYAIVCLLAGCATCANRTASYSDEEINTLKTRSYQSGFWAGWRTANQTAGRGL